MKKLLLSLTALATVASALPAAAQTWDHRPAYERNIAGVNGNINQREAVLRTRIERAVQRRVISPYEARRLREELRRIEALEHQYRRGGLNRREFNDLNARLDHVQAQLQAARHYRDFRW